MSRSQLSLIGAFVASGLLLFAVGLFMIGDRRLLFARNVQVATELERVRGVQVGTRVRVAGLDAGEVVQLGIPPGPGERFRITMRIREDLHHLVRRNSVASVLTDGLIGSVYIDVGGGTDAAPIALEGSLIEGREAIEVADLIGEGQETFRTVAAEMIDLREDIAVVITTLSDTVRHADELLQAVGSDVELITASGARIADSVESVVGQADTVVAEVRAGRGTLGRLLTDDSLYHRISEVARQTEETAASAQRTAASIERAAGEFGAEGGRGAQLIGDAQAVLAYAREAVADLAENTEALKRNWLFRGFFERRGFYDLRDVSLEEYRSGALEAGGNVPLRVWLDAAVVFETHPDGTETLTPEGHRRVESAMGSLLGYARDSPLVVEGYSVDAAPDVRFLRARDRADLVRAYVERRFGRSTALTGIMPIGSRAEGSPRSDGTWDGVALVLFVPQDAFVEPN